MGTGEVSPLIFIVVKVLGRVIAGTDAELKREQAAIRKEGAQHNRSLIPFNYLLV